MRTHIDKANKMVYNLTVAYQNSIVVILQNGV